MSVYGKAHQVLSGFSIDKAEQPVSVPGQGRSGSRIDTDRVRQEVRIDGSGRALLCTIPFSAWVLQRNAKAGVSLVYRNDDGVDASTLAPIRYSYQRKRGHVFCPGFSPHSVQIAQNAVVDKEYPDTAFCLLRSAVRARVDGASLAGNSWKSARSRAIAGSVRRVTTAASLLVVTRLASDSPAKSKYPCSFYAWIRLSRPVEQTAWLMIERCRVIAAGLKKHQNH